VNTKAETL